MKQEFFKNYTDAEIARLLKRAGMSATKQRIGLCHYILSEARHPTAEEIRLWATNNNISASLATIYNTLHTLCKAGYLKELRFPHFSGVIYDNNTKPHFHFLDEESGKITDLEENEFKISKKLTQNFEVQQIDVLIRGKIKTQRKSPCEK